jgi:hypothetical protein
MSKKVISIIFKNTRKSAVEKGLAIIIKIMFG